MSSRPIASPPARWAEQGERSSGIQENNTPRLEFTLSLSMGSKNKMRHKKRPLRSSCLCVRAPRPRNSWSWEHALVLY